MSWQNTKLNRPKSQEEKANPAQDRKNNQRLAYPRLRQEAEHKSLGGSPEKTAKPGHNYTYNNPASLFKNTCEPANPRVILRRRFNPRQVSMNIFMFLRWGFFCISCLNSHKTCPSENLPICTLGSDRLLVVAPFVTLSHCDYLVLVFRHSIQEGGVCCSCCFC